MLSREQIDRFWRDGYLLAENAVSAEQLRKLQQCIDEWVEESRAHNAPFGEPTVDGRPRFDMGDEHCAERPALRRINNPSEINPHYEDVMRNSRMVDMVAKLIGPNVKFHHSKTNAKLPHTTTPVRFHQDFPFTPHSNDDIVTVLLMLDEVSADNGCLEVVPGSHIWPEERQPLPEETVNAEMPAGSVLIYLGGTIHGGGTNRSNRSRTGLALQYSLGWLRQEENQYLAHPPEVAQEFTEELRRLIGYNYGGSYLGFVNGDDPHRLFEPGYDGPAMRSTPEIDAAKARLPRYALKELPVKGKVF